MMSSKLEILAQGVTLAMLRALKEYALEAQAGAFSDSELNALLARYGGSMVKALGHLQRLGERQRSQVEKLSSFCLL